jgi:outer membrane protein insertion porin family
VQFSTGTPGHGAGGVLGFGVGAERSILRLVVLATAVLLSCPSAAQDGATRIYVRRIEFTGVSQTSDFVLRRELLLFEGGYLNTVALDRSVQRLEALPFVDDAMPRLREVPGVMDLVDVVIEIVEAPARRYGGGGGYSEAFRTSLHGYFVNENLFGLGQRLGVGAERDDVSSSAELTHTQPYATTEGVSRTIELSSRRIDRLTKDASALAADFAAARLEYGYQLESAADSAVFEPLRRGACRPPIGFRMRLPDLADCSRESALRLGIELRSTELTAAGGASAQLTDWLSTNGDGSVSNGAVSTNLDEIDFFLGWRRDSRDRSVLWDNGLEQELTLRAALPGSDVEYYRADYEVEQRLPIGERWTLRLRGRLGYGAAYGSDTSSLPPHLNWFAGGPRTVRGYRDDGLGPRDSLGNPYGGDTLLAGQFEVMTAWPQRWRDSVRAGFFYDAGNVFSSAVAFYDEAGQSLDYGFDLSELRQSTGLALEVLLPFGLLRASYAVPLDAEEHPTSRFRRDDVERFQISVGVGF